MSNQFFDKILEATRAKKVGKHWKGHCPSHDDANPSLSISRANSGKVLVKCHSGCDQKNVIDALKSTGAWQSDSTNHKIKKSEFYYEDAETNLSVLRVIRTDRSDGTKSIFQQTLVDNEWVNGGTDASLNPYHFNKWRDSKNPIYIVEGEKCVHALEALGLAATTFVGGVNGWKSIYAKWFEGKDVIILPDNDSPGLKYGEAIAESVQYKAKSTKLIKLPNLNESEDIFDWIQKGKTRDDLENLVTNEPQFSVYTNLNKEGWSLPISLHMPSPLSIDPDFLPDPLRSFVEELAASTETPTDLATTLALGVISFAAATSFKVEIKEGYLEPLNLFLISALESGNRKTTVMNQCLEPLLSYEKETRESEKQKVYEAKSKRRNQEAELGNLRKKLGVKNGIPQPAILDRIKEIELNPIEVPSLTRLVCSDTTPEALASVMAENNDMVGLFSDEGGIFQILAGRYSGQVPNLDLILKAHVGSAHRVDRKNAEPIFLNEPLIALTLSPQPSVIKSMSQTPEFRDRGLFARFLFTIPQSPLGRRTGETSPMSERTKSAYRGLITKLLDHRKSGRDRIVLKFSEPALSVWKEMWKTIESYLADGGPLENAKDWGSKLPGHLARVAAIFHCIENIDDLPQNNLISSATMLRTECVMAAFLTHGMFAFDILKPDSDRVLAEKIIDWIKEQSLREFTQRDCHYRFKSTVESVSEIISALEMLKQHNFIRLKPQDQVNHRPSITFEVNPLETNQ